MEISNGDPQVDSSMGGWFGRFLVRLAARVQPEMGLTRF